MRHATHRMLTPMATEHPRPELIPTIIFGETPRLDPNPVVGENGRLIPGPDFSGIEFAMLLHLAETRHDTMEFSPLPTERQLGRISINQVFGCWELPTYQDEKNRARYGQMTVKGIPNPSGMAHRTMYGVFYGVDALPNGRKDLLDHLCGNKPCCYPRHLERVTHAVNTMRGRAAVRHITDQLSIEFDD